MSKKIKSINLVLPIIIVVIIIAIIIAVNSSSSNKGLLKKLSDNLKEKNIYQFSMKKDFQNKTIIVKNGEDTAIDTYNNGEHKTTMVKDGITKHVLHDREEYYIYNNSSIAENILIEWINDVLEKECTETGKEKVRGKTYYYEEYSGSSMFVEENQPSIQDENVKTRFYFDKNNNLVYVKTIYEGISEEVLKIEIKEQIDNEIFTIPENYAEN